MITLGIFHELEIARFTPQGAYLMNEQGDEVLLPKKYLEPNAEEGQIVNVFVMKDSQNRRVAVTDTPKLCLDEYAYLEIVEVNPYGAFADWGLDKNLFIPYREQIGLIEIGESHILQLKYDESTDRLIGSMKTRKALIPCTEALEGQKVNFLCVDQHELGWLGIVNNCYSGIIYNNDCIIPMKTGLRIAAYVFLVRPDGKLDLRLAPDGYEKYDEATEKLWAHLQENKFLFLTDKSAPEEINALMGMSKKTFKQAVGKLYKDRKIMLFDDKIARIDG